MWKRCSRFGPAWRANPAERMAVPQGRTLESLLVKADDDHQRDYTEQRTLSIFGSGVAMGGDSQYQRGVEPRNGIPLSGHHPLPRRTCTATTGQGTTIRSREFDAPARGRDQRVAAGCPFVWACSSPCSWELSATSVAWHFGSPRCPYKKHALPSNLCGTRQRGQWK
jgi:hypothetical protein